MTQREAYKNSYNAENMSDKCIDEEACILFKTPKISQRFKELQDELAKASIMTAQERLIYLSKVVREEEKEKIILWKEDGTEIERPADIGTKIKAIDTMNKMTGEYTTKIEGSVNVKLEDLL
jgi:phage terminase small subunit